ncbi:MAG: inorganic diphosphatase [Gemmatirosa sp.]
MSRPSHPAARLPPRPDDADDADMVHAVIETPQGSVHKIAYDEARGVFLLKRALPLGMAFPYDFGFVPSTLGDDGAPLDVMVLLDGPTAPGVLVEARLVGVIEAEQHEESKAPERNDRLLAVSPLSARHGNARTLDDVGARTIDEIERFLVRYQEALGRTFTPLGRGHAQVARQLVAEGARRFATKMSR